MANGYGYGYGHFNILRGSEVPSWSEIFGANYYAHWKPQQDAESTIAANYTLANSEFLSSSDAVFDVGDEDFTIGGWFFTGSGTAGLTSAFFSKWDNTGNNRSYAIIRNASNQFRISISSDGTTSTGVGTTTKADSTWSFVVAVYDSVADEIKISVDGAAFETASHSGGAYASSTADLEFGKITTASPVYLTGRTQNCFFYKKALSITEVQALHNSGTGTKYADLTDAQKTNLTAWWDMGEESGTRADRHSTYDLTDNATVTFAAGKVANTPDNGALITQLNDITGNGYDFVFASNDEAVFVNNVQDGVGGASFDGATEYAEISSSTNQFNFFHNGNGFYLIQIWKRGTSSGDQYAFINNGFDQSLESGIRTLINDIPSNNDKIAASVLTNSTAYTSGSANNQWATSTVHYIESYEDASDNLYLRLDGVQQGTEVNIPLHGAGNASKNLSLAVLRSQGGAELTKFNDGIFIEAIVVNTSPTAAQLAQVLQRVAADYPTL